MARDGWFDGSGLEPFRNALAARAKEIQEYMEDGKITKEEIGKQWGIVRERLEVLEPKLSDEIHKELTEIIIDLELATRMDDFNAGIGALVPPAESSAA